MNKIGKTPHKVFYAALVGLLLLAWFVRPGYGSVAETMQAEDTELPERPTPMALPPRPETSRLEPFRGGHIELHIAPAADIWTEVEWQGGDGQWHVVEGWRGYASKQGMVRWYVLQSHLNKGPYRWQLYLYEGGDYLATSEPFRLPAMNGDKVLVDVKAPALAAFLY
jgi:hypothetical protein